MNVYEAIQELNIIEPANEFRNCSLSLNLPDHVRIIDITAILLAAKRCSFSSLKQKVDKQ